MAPKRAWRSSDAYDVKNNELQNQYKRDCLKLEEKVSHMFLVFYPFMPIRPQSLLLLLFLSDRQGSEQCCGPLVDLGAALSSLSRLLRTLTSPIAFDPRSGLMEVSKLAFLNPQHLLPIQKCFAVIYLPRNRTPLLFPSIVMGLVTS